MDADEALARQLQAEEDAYTAQQHQQLERQQAPGDAAQRDFMRQLQSGVQTALRYEVLGAREAARQAMPLERLNAAAADAAALSRHMGEDPPLHHSDALVQEMLAWFKTRFFTWPMLRCKVDSPPCECCGRRDTVCTGTEAPSQQEAADGGAGRTEVYGCSACAAVTRFPRFNDPMKLLRTRRGRCGEWANCFCLCLRAAGLEARWVRDWADHVWCEYWSDGLRRWVHADPCEAAWDRPLLYEGGWGKQQSYVVALGRRGVADVTRRYTANFASALSRRTLVSESYLQTAISSLSSQLRSMLSAAELQAVKAAEAAEAAQLAAGDTSTSVGSLPGRQTGSVQWRATRGELGAQAAHPAPKPPARPPATRWRRAPREDEGSIQQSIAPVERNPEARGSRRRVRGAAIRASGENAPSETAAKVLDGRAGTKWLDFGGGTPGQATCLEVALLPDSHPANSGRLVSYALTAAGDAPERDPADWVLEGLPVADATAANVAAADATAQPPPTSDVTRQPAAQAAAGDAAATGRLSAAAAEASTHADALEAKLVPTATAAAAAAAPVTKTAHAAGDSGNALRGWRVLDAQEGVCFGSRGGRLDFQLGGNVPACSRWRLTVSRLRDPRAACAVQLACLDLYCHPEGAQAPTQQLGSLNIVDSDTGTAGSATGNSRQTEGGVQRASPPGASAAAPANAASATRASAAASTGSGAAGADVKAAFRRRVHEHFSRLMVAGSMSPAAAAAEALKLAAQG